MKVINSGLEMKGGFFGIYMSKNNLVVAGYPAIRRNPGCGSMASLTLLWLPAWNFLLASLGMEGILSECWNEGVPFYRRHQRIKEDWTQRYRMAVYLYLKIL